MTDAHPTSTGASAVLHDALATAGPAVVAGYLVVRLVILALLILYLTRGASATQRIALLRECLRVRQRGTGSRCSPTRRPRG